MNFLKKLLNRPVAPATVPEFWSWFLSEQHSFFTVIQKKDGQLIHNRFLDKIVPRLHALNPRFYCETGMTDDTTAELVVSAEGDIPTFVFVEELIAAAPTLPNWKFTALKPSTGIRMSIKLNGTPFDSDTIRFFYDEEPGYPDEINLTIIHEDFSEDNKNTITQGCLLYMDALLGELNAATLIDDLVVGGPADAASRQLIPMEKLGDFLTWKEKEFVEKYEGARHNTENDQYAALEGEDANGLPSIAIINTDLLDWDARASHPWMAVVTVDYTKTKGMINNGMPGEEQFSIFNELQEELDSLLIDSSGYLNLGRETYNGKSEIYYACREFRNISKLTDRTIRSFEGKLACSYTIYKDKYWRTMDKYAQTI